MEVTILYYTGNTEDKDFEDKIIAKLIENSNGLPIVSVSQKPINLGRNICIGDIGHSYESEFAQIKIGLEAIDTEYVIVAESDTIYPPEYFWFKPDGEDCYRFDNVWVLYRKTPFWFKGNSHCAQMVKREAWLEEINGSDGKESVQFQRAGSWHSDKPVVTFMTGNGVSSQTYIKDERRGELPYWGNARELRNAFCTKIKE